MICIHDYSAYILVVSETPISDSAKNGKKKMMK